MEPSAPERGPDVAPDASASEHGFEVITPSGDAPSDVSAEPDAKHSSEEGMHAESKRLYEGGRQDHVIDWVEEMPEVLKNLVPDNEDSTKRFALLLRTQVVNRKQKLHSIVVQSPLIKEALEDILNDYPGVYLGSDTLVFEAPFKPFVHRWQPFVDACENHSHQASKQHLQLLKAALEPELKESFAAIRCFAEGGVIEYNFLWAIFPPGRIAIAEKDKAVRAFKIKKTEYNDQDEQHYFILHGGYVDWNGKIFGRTYHVIAVAEFDGTAGQSDLPAHPLEYHPDKEDIIKMLVHRGRLFASLAGVFYKAYDGPAVCKTDGRPTAYHVTGRIVVDAKTSSSVFPHLATALGPLYPAKTKLNSRSRNTPKPYAPMYQGHGLQTFYPVGTDPFFSGGFTSRYQNEDHLVMQATLNPHKIGSKVGEKGPELTEEDLMLCSHEVKGFSLKLKKWLDFDVNLIKDIKWNDQAFESLALPGDYKHLLLAFAKSQTRAADIFDDVIEGKGKGMVMLLEGPPGVGKTLTVESVAEEMRVPLYSISAGDLGTDAPPVQSKLNTAFETAVEWNAVILLDEADIFLEKRSINDLHRNQLVSVFLQSLEYYRGTIFLTTNRISCMDPAFNSRIHISLPYPPLNHESRSKIWTNFLRSLKGIDATELLVPDCIERLARRDLNGRQVKNMVKMASLLAASEGGKMKVEHVDTVLRISGEEGAGAAYAE